MSTNEHPPARPTGSGSGTGARVWAYVLVALLLAVYFVWVCVQMAAHVRGGDALLAELAIGISAVAIALVAGASAGRGRATSRVAGDKRPRPVAHRDRPRTPPSIPRSRIRGPRTPVDRRGPARRAGGADPRARERSGRS